MIVLDSDVIDVTSGVASRQFGEFASFALFEGHVGVQWLTPHAVDQVGQTVGE